MQLSPLPPCPIKFLRDYLRSIDFEIVVSLTTDKIESWASKDNMEFVQFPTDDPMLCSDVAAVLEMQLHRTISEIPFYAKHLAHRFRPDGTIN